MNSDTTSISLTEIAARINSNPLHSGLITLESINPFKSDISFPIRIDALVMILVEEGHARLRIDLRDYEIGPHTLIVLQPRNYINLMASDDAGRARTCVLMCSRHVVEDVLPKLTDVLPLLMRHRTQPVVGLEREDFLSLRGFFRFIHFKLNAEPSPFMRPKLMCLLQAALFEMMEIIARANPSGTVEKSRREELMARFLILVSEEFRTHRQVSYYADRMCITPKHLSTVVKQISGRTAGEWIDSYVIMEAKVMLRSTDLSIQEVAARLNFTNQSFFGKYFKQHTGESPSRFRRPSD